MTYARLIHMGVARGYCKGLFLSAVAKGCDFVADFGVDSVTWRRC